jgi:serine/threonine protein kinase/tetratricopeptide (TPR) repeat protein
MNDPSSVLALVEEALDSGRTPEAVCADRPELLADVRRVWERCLRNDVELNELFSPPTTPSGVEGTSLERPGTTVGPYVLLQPIGEGGFGTVYLAEQMRPVRRRVALKVVKPGMDTRGVIARFEAERQALAMMDHPNIARVLDAGATDSGRPFFVMELVDGLPVTAFCDFHRLTVPQRLGLTVQVCHAVQSAHQKGVIHRDLKPSNVLVVMHDGVPVPKVIDFGIAKATGALPAYETFSSAFGGYVGTPAYMSPEQAEPSRQGIDTRTDVYSLGVLLYELLTGTTPLDAQALKAAPHAEVFRLIREADPLKPSSRLPNRDDALVLAANRGTDPKRLLQAVRGELDWIVMKALEKDRTRRYESAAALAEDLSRHLAGEPVVAGPPGRVYRFRKLARKYRTAIAAAGLVVVVLMLGVAGTTVGLVREARQRHLAEARRAEADAQRQTAQAVVAFLTRDVLAQARPSNTQDKAARDTLVKTLIEPALRTVGERFAGQPLARAAVRTTLASTLVDLGRYDLAMPQAESAWHDRRKLLGDEHPDTIRALALYASTLNDLGRHAQAAPLAYQAWQRSRRTLTADHPDAIAATYGYALNLTGLGRREEAEPLFQEVWQRRRRRLGDDHPETIAAMVAYGRTLAALGRRAQAEPLLREAWERSRRVSGLEHPDTILAQQNYASLVHDLGRSAEAEPLLREAWERDRQALGDDHPETLWAQHKYAEALTSQGRLDEAEPLYRGSWERSRRALGDDHAETIIALRNYAQTSARRGRWAVAEPLFRQEWESLRKVLGEDNPETIIALHNGAVALAKQGRVDAAKAMFAGGVAGARRTGQAGTVRFAGLLFMQADFLRQSGDPAGAVAPLREATDILRATAPNDPNRGRDLYWLGMCLLATGRPADAELVFRENCAYDLAHPGPDGTSAPGSLEGLIASLKAQGKSADEAAIRAGHRPGAPANGDTLGR